MAKNKHFNFDFRWLILFVVILSAILTTIYLNNNKTNEGTDLVEDNLDIDNGDLKINWDNYPTTNIKLSESLTITSSGTYHITGKLDDGNIKINTHDTDFVRLILDNVSITNLSGPAIFCSAADDLVIELIGENDIEDSANYSADYDEDVTGVIYSKADLAFRGDGKIKITANKQDAIISKDDLIFRSGTYNIDALDDAIRGKDSVYVTGGSFIIESGADAIKTTNETDHGKGFLLIDNGNFNISASAKGLKATNGVLINDGIFTINSYDDAIHSNDYVGIIGGKYNINSGDDGIHADRELIIDGGEISINKAYEGLESQVVTINDGNLKLTTFDDGINAGGGADESAKNRPGANPFNSDENCILSINGGTLYINSSGDGVDSNGWLYFNGGNTIVDGPANDGNGALDAGMGIVMNGGEVLAIGSSGMAESLGSSSNIHNISIYLSTTFPSDTVINIKDKDENNIFSHTSAKSFNHIAAGSSNFILGETYTLYVNDEKYTSFTIADITTTVGNSINHHGRP